MPLIISKHPLVADSLRGLRDSSTPPDEFRVLARKVITLLLYEATADLPAKKGTVRTPLADAPALTVDQEVVAIPVLRAGLGLLAPVLELRRASASATSGSSGTRRLRSRASTTRSFRG